MSKRLVGILAGAMLAGCQLQGLSPVKGASEASEPLSDEHGLVQVRVNWPARADWLAQEIPAVALRLELTIRAASEALLAELASSRAGAAESRMSVALPPGEGYTAEARFYDENGFLVAQGRSSAFEIRRQQVASVALNVKPVISTFAGTEAFGFEKGQFPATSAMLRAPNGLAATTTGEILIADTSNHAIRRVGRNGILTTLAGTGTAATLKAVLGESSNPLETPLSSPISLAVAPNGDIVIADYGGNGIRVLAAKDGERYGQTLKAGQLHTVFLASVHRSLLSVASDTAGNLFIADLHRIWMMTPEGERVPVAGTGVETGGDGPDGPALEIPLNVPDGFVADSDGNLLFVERSGHRVRMLCRQPGTYFGIPMASGSVFTLAGTGQATLANTPVGDGKPGTEATLNHPRGLALDGQGNLYIADTSNQRIRRLSPERMITTFAGTSARTATNFSNLGDGLPFIQATFANPIGLVVSRGQLFVGDASNHRVRRLPL